MNTTLTRRIAWQAASDAGTRTAKAAGRSAWNHDDYMTAVAEFDRLWPNWRNEGAYEPAAQSPIVYDADGRIHPNPFKSTRRNAV